MSHCNLFWFSHDLRLHDNPALLAAATQCDRLLCVYLPATLNHHGAIATAPGSHRTRFLAQSLQQLQDELARLGQDLLVLDGTPAEVLGRLITRHKIRAVYRAKAIGVNERTEWQHLRQRYPELTWVEQPCHTLWRAEQLPFPLQDLPAHFTPFRLRIDMLDVDRPMPAPDALPPPPPHSYTDSPAALLAQQHPQPQDWRCMRFTGGCQAAQRHLEAYFSSPLPLSYKTVRNELDGWNHSTKFSPWLANGSLSVRALWWQLYDYERQYGSNESTDWIRFELLWREFFQWYALRHGARLFSLAGIRRRKPLTSYYPERYQRWRTGNTPWPLVNACMKQLNSSGYLSNRGRQIVASCLVNELQLDWRYGAAWFEHQLLDYDVASNWGNWQYLAGVGADPRGQRHFDLAKQAAQFDPDGRFVRTWQGHSALPVLDSVDAADWPVAYPGGVHGIMLE